MGCCTDSAILYLKVANSIISLIGITLLSIGIYILVDPSFSVTLSSINQFAVYAPFLIGGIVFLVGVLGCCGATERNKLALLLFWIILTTMVLAVTGMGVAFMLSIGTLDDINNVKSSADLADDSQTKLNDAVAKVYDTCCPGQTPFPVQTLDCSDEQAIISLPPPLDELLCISDQNFYDSFAIPQEFCTSLQQVIIEGSSGLFESDSVVGPLSCITGALFRRGFTLYLEETTLPIAITLIILAALLLIADIFTCVVICTNRVDFDREYRVRVQEQEDSAVPAA